MPSNKPRLHIALYARGGKPTMPKLEDKYHWALLVGPKVEDTQGKGVRYHAKQIATEGGRFKWLYEEGDVRLTATHMLLIRITIAKIQSMEQVRHILRSVPVEQDKDGWNCVAWVQKALEMLRENPKALGTGVIDWKTVRDTAMSYCDKKKEGHRFDGEAKVDTTWAPTFNLITGKEVIP